MALKFGCRKLLKMDLPKNLHQKTLIGVRNYYEGYDVSFENDIDISSSTMVPKFVNEVKLMGVVTSCPKRFDTSYSFTSFRMVTLMHYKNAEGESKSKSTWHSILAGNENLQAYIKNFIFKGSFVYVSGYLSYKKDKNFQAYVVANDVIALRNKVNIDID